MRRTAVILATGLVVLAAIFWTRHAAPPARAEIRNVLLISLDTTRADVLGCYGSSLQTTPNIDAVAADGVLFENVTAPAPLTLPSHASMFTGLTPPEHGVRDNLFAALAPATETLAEVLRSEGFSTGAVVSAVVLHRMYGLDQGFDSYRDRFEGPTVSTRGSERAGDDTSRQAIEWLDEHGGERFFLFLHYYDPHFPYTPPEPFASRFRDNPYAGEVAFTDHCVGVVIDKLKALGIYDSTLVVIVGDHGEMLGEHQEPAHGYFIYQSALRVPLIVRVPGVPARRVQAIAGVVDVTPTICALLGVDAPSPRQGIDLSPLLEGVRSPGEQRYLYCESLTPRKYQANGLWGLVGDRWKYIRTTTPELYDLHADPRELENVVSSHPLVARELAERLAVHLADAAGRGAAVDLDEETLARLRSLGYVGGAVDPVKTAAFDPGGDDPKDLIGFHNRFIEFQHLVSGQKYDRASEIGGSLLARRPDTPVVLQGLGGIALKRGRYLEAIEYARRTLAIDPDHFLAAKDLGEAQAALGHTDAAIESYRRAIRIRPNASRVHYNLAHLYYRRGDLDRALEHANVSARLTPEVPAVQVSLAATYLELGRYARAIEHYAIVVELEPRSVGHLDTLAWLLATRAEPSQGTTADAVRYATRACELSKYGMPRAIETLAAALAARGDFPSAVERAERAVTLYVEQDNQASADEARRRLKLYRAGRPYHEPGEL